MTMSGARTVAPPAVPPPRRLVFKQLKAAPVLPADFEDSTWLRLKAAVAAIHAQKPSPTTFEDLYRDVEALCLHGMADRLYARLASAVDAHVGSELQALSERAKTASAATTTAPAGAGSESGDYGAEDSSRALFFLPQFDATWRSHCTCMLTLRQVFAPLDAATATGSAANRGGGGANTSAAAGKAVAASPSSFSTSSAAAAAAAAASVVAARQPLHEMGLALFRAHLSAHPEVATRAAAGLLATVAAERRLSGAAAEAAMAAATGVEIPHGLPSSAAPSAPATPVDRGLAASVSRALAALSLYQRALEAPLLARSDAFYRAEGSRLLACPALPPALYLRHAERRLAEEAERALAYLERGTRAPLMKVAEAQLLARHIPALLEAGVPAFFDADLPLGGGGGGRGGGGGGGGEEAMATDDGAAAPPPPPAAATSSAAAAADQLLRNRVGISGDGLDDLRRLSAAASRVRASDALRAAFKAHVKSRGEGLMMAAAAPASAGGDAAAAASASKRLIPDLLLLKARADAAVRGAFGSREAFAVALKEAFEGFINRQGGRAAELLAKHVDAELRGGASGMKASDRAAAAAAAAAASKQPEQQQPEEADLDQRLDAALALFRFVEGKDVFEAFYKRDLARRLLLGGGDPSSSSSTSSSADSDAERAVLAKLKVECGAGFTSKLEGMFKDVALSKELLSSFRASAEAAAARERGALPANLDVSVSVLTAGFWPTYGGVGVGGGGGGSGGGGETGGGGGGGNPSPTVGARASDATATPAGGATSSSPTFLLPSPLSGAAAAFADHYLQKHRGRRLTWMHELSTAVLRARFDGSGSGGGSSAAPKPAQSKELIVSLHQASVLLLFNDVEAPSGGGGGGGGAGALSLAQVAERTGLPAREARLVLASLALARVRPLVREAGGAAAAAPAVGTAAPAAGGGLAAAAASISETDSFRVAASVASPLFRVRLNAAQLRESSSNSASDESRRIGEAVDQDRAHAVDAAIVRIMKTRRSLAHKLLARELAAQLRFAVAGPALKKRVESLIDREFLARDEADPSVYNYLA